MSASVRPGNLSSARCTREAQSIDWSTMAINDLQVAVGERVETAEFTLRQVGGDTYERIPLFGGEQAWGLGYHAANSAARAARAGSGTGLPNLSQQTF